MNSKQEAIIRGWSASPVKAEQLVNSFACLADLSASWPTTMGTTAGLRHHLHRLSRVRVSRWTYWHRLSIRWVSRNLSYMLRGNNNNSVVPGQKPESDESRFKNSHLDVIE